MEIPWKSTDTGSSGNPSYAKSHTEPRQHSFTRLRFFYSHTYLHANDPKRRTPATSCENVRRAAIWNSTCCYLSPFSMCSRGPRSDRRAPTGAGLRGAHRSMTGPLGQMHTRCSCARYCRRSSSILGSRLGSSGESAWLVSRIDIAGDAAPELSRK